MDVPRLAQSKWKSHVEQNGEKSSDVQYEYKL